MRAATGRLRDGDPIDVAGLRGVAISVPGHTAGGVAYFFPDGAGGDVFTGDTLFGGTMGNLFEGTPLDMLASLRKLRALPAATRVWFGHEYTIGALGDALRIEPDHPGLLARLAACEAMPSGTPTCPTVLADEAATNPFLRWDDPALQARLRTEGDEATFVKLCEIT